MTIRCKLTTRDSYTRKGEIGETKWRMGKTIAIDPRISGNKLCSREVLHFYDSPAVAVFLNCIHANFPDPICYAVQDHGTECAYDGVKGGAKKLTPIRRVKLPKPTTEQRVEFAIRVAAPVMPKTGHGKEWHDWARKWRSGKDRSCTAANAAANAAYAAANAANAANAAASAAASAAYAAYAAANAACAAYAANAAASAAASAAYAAASANIQKFRRRIVRIAREVLR